MKRTYLTIAFLALAIGVAFAAPAEADHLCIDGNFPEGCETLGHIPEIDQIPTPTPTPTPDPSLIQDLQTSVGGGVGPTPIPTPAAGGGGAGGSLPSSGPSELAMLLTTLLSSAAYYSRRR